MTDRQKVGMIKFAVVLLSLALVAVCAKTLFFADKPGARKAVFDCNIMDQAAVLKKYGTVRMDYLDWNKRVYRAPWHVSFRSDAATGYDLRVSADHEDICTAMREVYDKAMDVPMTIPPTQ